METSFSRQVRDLRSRFARSPARRTGRSSSKRCFISLDGAAGIGGLLIINESGISYVVGYDGNGNLTSVVKADDGSVAASYEYDASGVLNSFD